MGKGLTQCWGYLASWRGSIGEALSEAHKPVNRISIGYRDHYSICYKTLFVTASFPAWQKQILKYQKTNILEIAQTNSKVNATLKFIYFHRKGVPGAKFT